MSAVLLVLAWTIGGGLAVLVALIIYARWLARIAAARQSAKGFVLDHVPFTSDVAATEASLPELRDTYTPTPKEAA